MWHGAIENLSPHASPCRYLSPTRWVAIRDAALDFCTRLGADAHALGWTEQQLFAVHPEHGTIRLDYCGVLVVSGSRALSVEADRIVFERTAGYRNKQGQVWGVPVWAFKPKRD